MYNTNLYTLYLCKEKSNLHLMFSVMFYYVMFHFTDKFFFHVWNDASIFVVWDLVLSRKRVENRNSGRCWTHSLPFFQTVYGGKVLDQFDRRILFAYLDEYLGDFLFDEFQPFHFYKGSHREQYAIPYAANTKAEFLGNFLSIPH